LNRESPDMGHGLLPVAHPPGDETSQEYIAFPGFPEDSLVGELLDRSDPVAFGDRERADCLGEEEEPSRHDGEEDHQHEHQLPDRETLLVVLSSHLTTILVHCPGYGLDSLASRFGHHSLSGKQLSSP